MMKICCFTGHRPKLFPWGTDEQDTRCLGLKKRLKESIYEAIDDGFDCFITGGALGVDTWAAEIVLRAKRENAEQLFFELALPYESYNKNLGIEAGGRLERIQDAADKVTVVSGRKNIRRAFYERDHYMVDKSQRLIAVYDDASDMRGGTYLTLQYAIQKGIEIRQIQWMHLE